MIGQHGPDGAPNIIVWLPVACGRRFRYSRCFFVGQGKCSTMNLRNILYSFLRPTNTRAILKTLIPVENSAAVTKMASWRWKCPVVPRGDEPGN
jgi:hypothetical protein